jgi:hypothetical protein
VARSGLQLLCPVALPDKKRLESVATDRRLPTAHLMKDESGIAFSGLRSAALLALVFGVAGSIGLWRHAPQHPPPLLAVLFVIWIIAPFGLLGFGNFRSKNWPIAVRKTLYAVTLAATAASLAIYLDDSFFHRTAHPAGVWVAVPPASVILSGLAIAIVALISKRKTHDNG